MVTNVRPLHIDRGPQGYSSSSLTQPILQRWMLQHVPSNVIFIHCDNVTLSLKWQGLCPLPWIYMALWGCLNKQNLVQVILCQSPDSKLQRLTISTSCLLKGSFLESNHWAMRKPSPHGDTTCGCSGQRSQLRYQSTGSTNHRYVKKDTSRDYQDLATEFGSLTREALSHLGHKLWVPPWDYVWSFDPESPRA